MVLDAPPSEEEGDDGQENVWREVGADHNSIHVVTYVGGIEVLAKLKITKSFDDLVGPSVLERLVGCLLCLAAASLLVVFITGGYRFTIGPIHVSVPHLRNPLLLLLALALVKAWLRGERMGMPALARLRSPLVLFLGVVFIYNLNGRTTIAGDTIPARYLPLSLLREFDFDLDEFPFLYEPQVPYFLQRIDGHVVSAYPPWAAVLALPVYLLPVLGGLAPQSDFLLELEKVSATLITAMSVVILFLALRRLTRENIAWVIAVVYAFGTSSFSTSSQALFQHGSGQLFLALTLYWLVRGLEEPRWSAYAGFALAVAIICRPVNGLIALPIGAYTLQKRRDQLMGFLLASFPPLLLFMAYNIHYFGSPFTTGFIARAVSPSSFWKESSHLLSTPLLEGLIGVLASPGRGLLIYSPVFVFSFIGMAMVWRGSGQILFKYLSLAPFLFIITTAKWVMWWGGHSFGPRLLADITPILCLYLYPPFEWSEGKAFLKAALIGLGGLSVGLHALGAFGDGSWNYTPINVDSAPKRLWSWVDSPPIYYGREMVTEVGQAFARLKRSIVDMPTSLDAPQQLAASYNLISLVPGPTVDLNEPLTLQVTTLNTGKALWLARGKGERGAVRLGWRWFKGDHEVPTPWGRGLLKYDILPGGRYRFTAMIASPREPGEYLLEVGLITEQVAWFSEQGVAPLKIPVRVLGPPDGDFHTLLAKGLQVIGDPPALAIASDRPHYRQGDNLTLTVDLVNSAPRTVDVYVALSGPDGMLSFWDGMVFSQHTGGRWVPLRRGVKLDDGVQLAGVPLLAWQLVDLANGPYTVSLVLTESNVPNVVAKAQVIFTLEP
jgi:hypothetical protein